MNFCPIIGLKHSFFSIISGYHNHCKKLESLHQSKLLLYLSPRVVLMDIKSGYDLNLPLDSIKIEIMGKGYSNYTLSYRAMIYYDFDVDDKMLCGSFIIALPNSNSVVDPSSFHFNKKSSQIFRYLLPQYSGHISWMVIIKIPESLAIIFPGTK